MKVTRRGLIAGGVAAGALPLLHEVVPHQGLHDGLASAAGGEHEAGAHDMGAIAGTDSTVATAAHGGGVNGPTFKGGEFVDHAANGFNPTDILRDFDWGKTRAGWRAGRIAARVGGRRLRQGDRGRSRGHLPGLDLQRAGPRSDAAMQRRATCCGSASSTARPIPTRCTSTDSIRPRWTACRGSGAGVIAARGEHDLRVRCRSVRPAPLPLPRQPARRAHRSRDVRRASSSIPSRGVPRPTRW